MKAHSVKSNAKRASRKVAEVAPDQWEVAEPVPAEGGGWYAALQAKVAGLAHDRFVVHPVPIAAALQDAADTPNEPDGTAGDLIAHMGTAEVPAEPETVEPTTKPVDPSRPKPVDPPTKPKPTAADIAAALPPPTRSTPEEIAARREERRQRIEAEKAAGTRDRQGNKVEPARSPKRADIIVALVSRPDGATTEELMTATGWQRHTLRGYIAGTLRKRNLNIISTKGVGGASTVYRLQAAA